jgi:hypothetical protein
MSKEPTTIPGKVNRIMRSNSSRLEKVAALRDLGESDHSSTRAITPWTVAFSLKEWLEKNGKPGELGDWPVLRDLES